VTYCVGLRLDQGIVFASDTRTNAGLDDLGTLPRCMSGSARADRVSC
jgi:putative proteasome-type protease